MGTSHCEEIMAPTIMLLGRLVPGYSSQCGFRANAANCRPLSPGTNVARLRSRSMGPREEDNNVLLLVVVSLISATLVGIFEVGKTRPAVAARPPVTASEQPVRVILPFTPNTTASER